jgi:hypothetical protein
MILSRPLRVTLSTTPGSVPHNLLVGVDIRLNGKYYYGTILPLTDQDGSTSLIPERLRADFRHSQELFPMDYKVSLDSCDDTIGFVILGGAEFVKERDTSVGNGLVDPDAQDSWAKAANEFVVTKRVDVSLGTVAEAVSISIDVRKATA